MCEHYMVRPEDIKDVRKDGKIIGFDMQVKNPYHTDVQFENIAMIQVRVDNMLFYGDDITFTIQGKSYQMQDLEISSQRWTLEEKAVIHVPLADGLSEGTHIVELGIGIINESSGNVHPSSDVCYITS